MIYLDYAVKFRAFGVTFGPGIHGTVDVTEKVRTLFGLPFLPIPQGVTKTLIDDRGIKVTLRTV